MRASKRIASGMLASALVAGLVLAGAATAQVPRGMGPLTLDQQRLSTSGDTSSRRIEEAINALQSKNYGVAEALLADALRHDPKNNHANFLMGVTAMGLEKWPDAKKHLEIAVSGDKKNPDPKSRLGVTLIKLGDIDGAMKQRAELAVMSDKCKAKCRNAEWIASGLAMIDAAMPPKPAG